MCTLFLAKSCTSIKLIRIHKGSCSLSHGNPRQATKPPQKNPIRHLDALPQEMPVRKEKNRRDGGVRAASKCEQQATPPLLCRRHATEERIAEEEEAARAKVTAAARRLPTFSSRRSLCNHRRRFSAGGHSQARTNAGKFHQDPSLPTSLHVCDTPSPLVPAR